MQSDSSSSNPTKLRSKWREMRVFVSSTFRDFQAERDFLVRSVFPRLRERLEKYRIHFVDIDLRWGVTKEQADNDQALELCLVEIDKCRPETGNLRPFFIGMLGERYGWVPKKVDPGVLKRYTWIPDYRDHSVTALEIIHGVLLNPPMKGQSFFYFRDPACFASMPYEVRSVVMEDEDAASRPKLVDLKNRIRSSHISLMDGYPCSYAGLRVDPRFLGGLSGLKDEEAILQEVAEDGIVTTAEYNRLSRDQVKTVIDNSSVLLEGLEEFGERIYQDLIGAIGNQYPEINRAILAEEKIDQLSEELDFHERFAESRLRFFFGREAIRKTLLEYLESDSQEPLGITGPSGCGKSALLAKVVGEYRDKHPDDSVVQHFIGASSASTFVSAMLSRFCGTLKREFALQGEIPSNPSELPAALQRFFGMVPESKRVALFIDGLDQLDAFDREKGLSWLPFGFPKNVKMVVSCLDDEAGRAMLEELKRRKVQIETVPPLDKKDIASIIDEVPSLSAKTLDTKQREHLLSNPAAFNPLYVQVALEELRGFGSFQLLDERIKLFTKATDVVGLFGQVIETLELYFGKQLVKELLCLLGASRSGLSERELSELLSETDAKAEMQTVLRQLRPYLMKRGELIDCYHLALKRAIAGRYFEEGKNLPWHVRLADYFSKAGLTPRKIEELPWELEQGQEWKRLYELLSDLKFFAAAWDRNQYEVKAYWAKVEGNSSLRMINGVKDVVDESHRYETKDVWNLGILLYDTGHLTEAMKLRSFLVTHYHQTDDKKSLQACYGIQALILRARGQFQEAMDLHKKQETLCIEIGDKDGLQSCYGNQANILSLWGRLQEAMDLYKKKEALCVEMTNKDALQACYGNQAGIFQA